MALFSLSKHIQPSSWTYLTSGLPRYNRFSGGLQGCPCPGQRLPFKAKCLEACQVAISLSDTRKGKTIGRLGLLIVRNRCCSLLCSSTTTLMYSHHRRQDICHSVDRHLAHGSSRRASSTLLLLGIDSATPAVFAVLILMIPRWADRRRHLNRIVFKLHGVYYDTYGWERRKRCSRATRPNPCILTQALLLFSILSKLSAENTGGLNDDEEVQNGINVTRIPKRGNWQEDARSQFLVRLL